MISKEETNTRREGNSYISSRILRKVELAAGSELLEAIKDPEITDIMLNEDGRMWAEKRGGRMILLGTMAPMRAMSVISSVAAARDIVASPSAPVVESEWENVRFEGLIPPVVRNPVFCFRKHQICIPDLDGYTQHRLISQYHRKTIEQGVKERANIVLSGGTGSGKTTFAKALLKAISVHEPQQRVVIIEDTSELNYAGQNFVSLKVSPGASAQDLLRATMRLRPDRIIVGEVRGGEALTLLKAWNTGHPGGVSTIHANSARAALTRLEQLIAEVSVTPIPHVIADAVDLIVHLERSPEDGVRRVVEVLSVEGYRNGEYLVKQIGGDRE